MRISLTSTYRTELRHLAEQIALAKRSVLGSLVPHETTSRGSIAPATVLAGNKHSRTEDISLFTTQLYAGDGSTSTSRDEVQKLWQDAQLERTRSQMY